MPDMPAHELDPAVLALPGILQINLRDTNSYTEWVFVGTRYSMSADVQPLSSYTWSTGVVGMEWSVASHDYANAVTFSPAVEFTATTKSRYNIDVASMVWIRFRVTTAEAANDPSAKIVYMIE